jgi:hypothetical protein
MLHGHLNFGKEVKRLWQAPGAIKSEFDKYGDGDQYAFEAAARRMREAYIAAPRLATYGLKLGSVSQWSLRIHRAEACSSGCMIVLTV